MKALRDSARRRGGRPRVMTNIGEQNNNSNRKRTGVQTVEAPLGSRAGRAPRFYPEGIGSERRDPADRCPFSSAAQFVTRPAVRDFAQTNVVLR
ncbi:hypothetical protein AAFF_G00413480 [Aldrovandia affinis]|uniref:Uncharacterized protein n=1 Tax=Aldrovandia affinis TaxID=143900 RepID=A0AAD7SB60_9TELE|nr:hypothetical protein AAFF_G00413480 [Aldrovandia affinis]